MAERKTAKPKTFEQMLARLDEIVRSLDDARSRSLFSLYTEGAEPDPHLKKQARRGRADRCEAAKGADGAPVETSFLYRRTNDHGSFQRI